MSLHDFLLERIAEEERHARKLAETEQRPVLSLAATINHPERILLECEAKRAVLKIHARLADSPDDQRYEFNHDSWMRDSCVGCNWGGPCDDYHVEHVDQCPTLRALALPYADHDDYDESWRP